MNFSIRTLESVDEMKAYLPLIQLLSPHLTAQDYHEYLSEMIPHNYRQLAIFAEDKCIGISGYWIATKLYCGRYLEVDNLVVDTAYRNLGIGSRLLARMQEVAASAHCKVMMLDAYVENFDAHKFYYREGFIARGFHYIKWL